MPSLSLLVMLFLLQDGALLCPRAHYWLRVQFVSHEDPQVLFSQLLVP